MRTNTTRWVLAVSTMVALSGCYSNGQWSSPNLAFWKPSPFQSTPGATPSAVGPAVKPSGIAANSRGTPTSGRYPPANSGAVSPTGTLPGSPNNYNAPATGVHAKYRLQHAKRRAIRPLSIRRLRPGPPPTPALPATADLLPTRPTTAGVPGANAYGTPPPSTTGARGLYGNGTSSGGYSSGSTAPSSGSMPNSYSPGSGYTPNSYNTPNAITATPNSYNTPNNYNTPNLYNTPNQSTTRRRQQQHAEQHVFGRFSGESGPYRSVLS